MTIAYRLKMQWKDAIAQGESILQDLSSIIIKTWITEWEWAQKQWEVKHYSWVISNQKTILWSMNQSRMSQQVLSWIFIKFQTGAQKIKIKWKTFWLIRDTILKILKDKTNKLMIHRLKNIQVAASEAKTNWTIKTVAPQVSTETTTSKWKRK